MNFRDYEDSYDEDVERFVNESQYTKTDERFDPIKSTFFNLVEEIYDPASGQISPHTLRHYVNKMCEIMNISINDLVGARTA